MSSDASIIEYRFGPFTLDCATGRLHRDGEEISLPPRASLLLERLLEEAGAVCTEAELVEAVWPDVPVGADSLAEAVGVLRHALGEDDPHGPAHVEAVAGRGYRLVADVQAIEAGGPEAGSSHELGQYQLLDRIGVGGMGRVYRARDARLGREVAIKTLPPEVAADPSRVKRFEREAKLLAALNHPNVATLFGLEEWEGQRLLVMELVEGETLAARIERGPVASAEALRFAAGVARAMEAAHRRGIVHRDLKPSNVMVTRDDGIKVLDFGIAKALRAAGIEETVTGQSETVAPTDLTGGVALLGTPPYMSPEQIRGQEVDERVDIWALGCILYETLTGRRAFARETAADTLAAILEDEPDWDALPSDLPVPVRSLLVRCLRKDPSRRLHHAADARIELEEGVASLEGEVLPAALAGAGPRPDTSLVGRAGGSWAWLAAAVVLVAAIAVLLPWLLGPIEDASLPAPSRPLTFSVALPSGSSIGPGEVQTYLAMSPGGERLAFVDTVGRLFVHDLQAGLTRQLEGIDGAATPLWSPDGRFLAFLAEGKLRRVAAAGGPPQVVCDADWEAGTSWGARDVMLFSQPGPDGIEVYAVPAEGGTPEPVTEIDPEREIAHFWPAFLPDGRHFLYMALETDRRHSLYVGSIDGGEPVLVAEMNSRAVYVPTSSGGQLLYASEGSLVAQPFDPTSFELSGSPVVVADELRHFAHTGQAEFSAAVDPGRPTLAFHGGPWTSRLVWYRADGGAEETLGEPAAFDQVAISPDGTRVLTDVLDPRNGSHDLWVYGADGRMARRRLTSDLVDERYPIWSPDGDRIAYRSDYRGPPDIYTRAADGSGDQERLFQTPEVVHPEDWSDAAGGILYTKSSRQTGADQWIFQRPEGDHRALMETPFSEWGGRFSPDGELVAFVSDEAGRYEIYVAPVGEPGGRVPVSREGGISPRWSSDGGEIYFLGPADSVWVARIGRTPRLAAVDLSRLARLRGQVFRGGWDVAPDGSRFLVNEAIEDTRSAPIRLMVDWTSGLDRRE